MLLIDASYINNSGGLALLQVLINEFELINIPCYFLLDDRCKDKLILKQKNDNIFDFYHTTILNRYFFYFKNRRNFSKIFCFGNIPPPLRTNAIVYTYFHNINLLKIPNIFGVKQQILTKSKQFIIRHYSINSNYWIVQTENVKNELDHFLLAYKHKILIYPFWEEAENTLINPKSNRSGYVYVSNYTNAKNHDLLIKVWSHLHLLGFNSPLHLTLSNHPISLEKNLSDAIKNGANIINHGYLSKFDIVNLYINTKATIYPSFNESFGLGIIEAMNHGCDVIGPNLPYINSICIPSTTFNDFSVENIANAIIKYEKEDLPKTKIIVNNKLKEIISLLQ